MLTCLAIKESSVVEWGHQESEGERKCERKCGGGGNSFFLSFNLTWFTAKYLGNFEVFLHCDSRGSRRSQKEKESKERKGSERISRTILASRSKSKNIGNFISDIWNIFFLRHNIKRSWRENSAEKVQDREKETNSFSRKILKKS